MKHFQLKKLVLAALFLALGLLLPFLTGQIPKLGSALLPMHIPVLLCGLICGWQYGGIVGLILPPLRYLLFGMPPIFPTGLAMSFELAAYGLVIGVLYARCKKRGFAPLYGSLIAAMLCGRVLWGVVRLLCTGVSADPFTWQLFLSGAFVTAVPGIVLQLILIPGIMAALEHAGLVPLKE